MNSEIIPKILHGNIFIYPTDTLYGIGCNALNQNSVKKIRDIKGRDEKPFSVIAPSIDWIKEHFIVDVELENYLPGPYTVILKKKNPEFLFWVSNKETMGVRIPKHKFTKTIQKAEVPFITTSVNLSGNPPARTLQEIPESIKSQADEIIENDDEMSLQPSTLIIDGEQVQRGN